ncbi:MAG: hypothetical protein ACOC9Q_00760 [bacterium]
MDRHPRRHREREAWHPPPYDKADIRAIQSIAGYMTGVNEDPPSPGECQRALDWIIHTACGTYDEPFRPGADDVRSYLLGRRSVGLALVKMTKLKPELFDEQEHGGGREEVSRRG